MTQVLDLVPIWTVILAAAVFFYVLLDGFDLGVGMLYGLASDKRSRNTIMNSIAPIWDGNETWLVLGGLSLLAAFPTAFAVIIPAVYFPILVMLLGLVFRGVAFEFRVRDGQFAGTSLSFFTPFSVLTGVALMFGYGLLGAGWLIMKTEGAIQAAARRLGRICLVAVVIAIA